MSLQLLHPRHWLSWLGLLPLLGVAYLPWQARHFLGTQLGLTIARFNAKRRQVVNTNLQLCFPQLSDDERKKLATRSFQAYGQALVDYSILFFRPHQQVAKRIQIHGLNTLQTAVQNNKPIILLLGHSVWLEFAPLALGRLFSTYGSYKPFANPVFDHLIAKSRLSDVDFVLARDEGLMKLVRALQPGRLLFFLPDQDHGVKHSVFAPFFATTKATLTSPARIARLSGAEAFPIMTFFDAQQGTYHIHIGEKLVDFAQSTAEAATQQMNQAFEALIQIAPEQYMWTLKLLKTRPDQQPDPYKAVSG